MKTFFHTFCLFFCAFASGQTPDNFAACPTTPTTTVTTPPYGQLITCLTAQNTPKTILHGEIMDSAGVTWAGASVQAAPYIDPEYIAATGFNDPEYSVIQAALALTGPKVTADQFGQYIVALPKFGALALQWKFTVCTAFKATLCVTLGPFRISTDSETLTLVPPALSLVNPSTVYDVSEVVNPSVGQTVYVYHFGI